MHYGPLEVSPRIVSRKLPFSCAVESLDADARMSAAPQPAPEVRRTRGPSLRNSSAAALACSDLCQPGRPGDRSTGRIRPGSSWPPACSPRTVARSAGACQRCSVRRLQTDDVLRAQAARCARRRSVSCTHPRAGGRRPARTAPDSGSRSLPAPEHWQVALVGVRRMSVVATWFAGHARPGRHDRGSGGRVITVNAEARSATLAWRGAPVCAEPGRFAADRSSCSGGRRT